MNGNEHSIWTHNVGPRDYVQGPSLPVLWTRSHKPSQYASKLRIDVHTIQIRSNSSGQWFSFFAIPSPFGVILRGSELLVRPNRASSASPQCCHTYCGGCSEAGLADLQEP